MERMSALTDELRSRSDEALTDLLAERPDLASPAPSSVTALANRAGARVSVERALTGLTRFELQVAEAVVALVAATARPAPVPESAVEAGLGVDPSRTLRRLGALALVTTDMNGIVPVDPLAGAFGAHPCGLGPTLVVLDALHPGDRVTSPTTEEDLRAALTDAPEGARRVLDALTWGPPIGTVEPDHPGPGAAWLLERGILRRLSPTQLALPREVALAARGGRLLRDVVPNPPHVDAPSRPDAVVGSESAAAADRVVRQVAGLLAAWDDVPPTLVRAGGLAVREARRVANGLGVELTEAAFVVELAAMAGLIGTWSDGDSPTWVPTDDADRWATLDLPARWARLAAAWRDSTRAPWLVGTRADGGSARAALGDGLDRSWAPGLRHRLLTALTTLAEGAAPSAAQVHEQLEWAAPRATPTPETVGHVLREAAWLGLLGAGALAAAGRACAEAGPRGAGGASAGPGGAPEDELADALAADLPPEVEDLVIQADLTGVVPGRPSPGLDELLEACADVESRGSALTVRFTARSVARALGAGLTADELLGRLRSHARAGVPQPLEYLVADEARRHGAVRAGAAGAYLRSDDAAALAAIVADPGLAHLRLRTLAPTVAVSSESAAVLLESAREAGVGAVLEGPDGAVLAVRVDRRRPRARASRFAVRGAEGRGGGGPAARARPEIARAGEARLRRAAIVAAMREGDTREAAEGGRPGTGASPAHVLSALRDAAASGGLVTLAVAGPTGVVERRMVRPISVDDGRVRAVDVARLAELTVAVHRIVDVGPATG